MAIVNGYATLNQVKAAARMGTAVSDDDTLLEMSIETASRIVDGYCDRRFFTNGTEVRTYAAHDNYVLSVDDIAGTAITLKTSSQGDSTFDLTWAASDFQREPANATISGLASPITRLRAVGDNVFPVTTYPFGEEERVQVTAVFGFGTAVPTQVSHATILMSLRQFKRYGSPEGVLSYGDFAVRVGNRMDPDVAMILAPLRRTPVGLA
jgi:hypothetical protein